MKRLIFAVTMVLMAMVVLATGCSTKSTPAPTTSNVTGVLKDINTPDDPGADTVTITTPQGDKTFTLADNTTYSVEGRSCFLSQVGQTVDEGNATYECTVILAGLSPYDGETSVMAVYVTKK